MYTSDKKSSLNLKQVNINTNNVKRKILSSTPLKNRYSKNTDTSDISLSLDLEVSNSWFLFMIDFMANLDCRFFFTDCNLT